MRGFCPQEPFTRENRRTRSAFSLMELIVSAAVISVVMVAVGSAVVLASKALPSANSSTDLSVSAAAISDQVATELHSAVSITQWSATMIEFTVKRGGQEHTIRYEWPGSPGDPLTRAFDGGAPLSIMENVQDFALTYHRKTTAETQMVESSEILLLNNQAAYEIPYGIDRNNWIGQYFAPSLPPDATTWRVTRVFLRARSHEATRGRTKVQLRIADPTHLPTGTVLEEQVMDESNLTPAFTTREFSFANASGLAPSEGLCLVLQWSKDTYSADVSYETEGGSGLFVTSNKGATWVKHPGQFLCCTIHGTYTSEVPVTDDALESIGVRLSVGSDPSIRTDTEMLLLNRPELPEQ